MKDRGLFATILAAMVVFLLQAAPARAGVLRHYTFDTDYTDSSASPMHGTLSDVSPTGNSGITNVAGLYAFGGGAFNISGDRDTVSIPAVVFTTGSTWSVSCWARMDPAPSNNNNGMLIGKIGNSTDFLWVNQAPGGFRYRSSSNQNANFSTSAGNNWLNTAWHHYVLVASDADIDGVSDDFTLYVDNMLVNTVNSISTGIELSSIGDAYTGGLNVDFQGQIDEMWIFDSALDAATVANLFEFNALEEPQPEDIPEPVTLLLAGLTAGGLGGYLRRRRAR